MDATAIVDELVRLGFVEQPRPGHGNHYEADGVHKKRVPLTSSVRLVHPSIVAPTKGRTGSVYVHSVRAGGVAEFGFSGVVTANGAHGSKLRVAAKPTGTMAKGESAWRDNVQALLKGLGESLPGKT